MKSLWTFRRKMFPWGLGSRGRFQLSVSLQMSVSFKVQTFQTASAQSARAAGRGDKALFLVVKSQEESAREANSGKSIEQ